MKCLYCKLYIEVVFFFFPENIQNLFTCFCHKKPVSEFILIHQPRDSAEKLYMSVKKCFFTDKKKNKSYRFTIYGIKINRVFCDCKGGNYITYRIGFTVRNCKAFPDTGRNKLLPFMDSF